MALLALKVDVDTFRGTREGAPFLAHRLLQKHKANATFLFSLGFDHTGWALRRVLRPGFLRKVSRTSVIKHYGLKTLLYGVLLPAPDIGALADKMRAIASAGYECGIHCWDHVLWQDNVRQRDETWTRKQMTSAVERFHAIFGKAPVTHGAAGWQMNPHAFACLEELGFTHASDGRCQLSEDGALMHASMGPHRVLLAGREQSCIQLPTTLPTLDELLGRKIGGIVVNESNVASTLLRLTETPRDHVFTLHAELEGQRFAKALESLLSGWRAQGYELVALEEYYKKVKDGKLPGCSIGWGRIPGRSGEVIVQSSHSFCAIGTQQAGVR